MTDPVRIAPPGAQLTITGYAPTVWQHANLAAHWYRDAQREAQGGDGEHSTRREIVFAASFLESYIFEWIRDRWLDKLNDCFPPAAQFKPLKDKWKFVPLELHRAGILPTLPALDLSSLGTLVELRNGLVHARASRPDTSGQSKPEKPRPAMGELASLGHGWALGVAKALVTPIAPTSGQRTAVLPMKAAEERPNPSIEATSCQLRCQAAPHVER